MLEALDLTPKLSRKEYRARLRTARAELRDLQYQLGDHHIPGIVVLEGWAACGKGECLAKLVDALDPRWMRVHPIPPPLEHERLRPFLWRFWIKTPARGMVALFDHSWYGRVLGDRVDARVKKEEWDRAYQEINHFERWLADDGAAIVKLWYHITCKEQRRRMRRLEADPTTAWKVTRDDWREHRRYDDYVLAVEEMLEGTSTAEAPWTPVPAMDRRWSRIRTLEAVIEALRRAVEARSGGPSSLSSPSNPSSPGEGTAGAPGPAIEATR
jgi:polyphosphate kinase 2 (PPK2 family)